MFQLSRILYKRIKLKLVYMHNGCCHKKLCFCFLLLLTTTVLLWWLINILFFNIYNVLWEKYDSHTNASHKCNESDRFLTVYCLQEHGLGNNIFQIASAYGIAKHTNRTLIISPHCFVTKYFVLSNVRIDVSNVNMLYEWKTVKSVKASAFEKTVFELYDYKCYKTIQLLGYLQSWIYFSDILSDIKLLLKFKVDINTAAINFMSKARRDFLHWYNTINRNEYDNSEDYFYPTNIVFVGVHIRRGDMLTKPKKIFGYTVVNAQYLHRAKNYYENRFKHIIFVVCSDDMIWSRRNVKQMYHNNFVVFCDGLDVGEDLAILSLCNHTIVTVGSFSWWAGFLAGGDVLYFKNFPRRGSELENSFSETKYDYYLPHWVPI